MAGPILQLIKPLVSGIPDPAWFAQYASGHVQWAQNPTVALCKRLGVEVEEVAMGQDQYARYMSMATAGWNPALGAIPGISASKTAAAMMQSMWAAPDPEHIPEQQGEA